MRGLSAAFWICCALATAGCTGALAPPTSAQLRSDGLGGPAPQLASNDQPALPSATSTALLPSEIAHDLSPGETILAEAALRSALEHGRSGEQFEWNAVPAGRPIQIIPEAPFQHAGRDCRQAAVSTKVDDRVHRARASACRQDDGGWAPMT
jgi:surface antigen